jgi:hypothetical protein
MYHQVELSTRQAAMYCTYNVALRRVRATIVGVENNKYYIFWVCVCSLMYPACQVYAPYYIVIRGLSGCTILFSILSHKRHIFREKNLLSVKMCVLIFSTTFVCNISNSKKI